MAKGLQNAKPIVTNEKSKRTTLQMDKTTILNAKKLITK